MTQQSEQDADLNTRLARAVAYRRAQPVGEHPQAAAILNLVTKGLGSGYADRQGVPWYGRTWVEADGWNEQTRQRISKIAASFEPSGDGGKASILRSDVFDRSDDPVDLFLVAMAWGFGTMGYGCWRTINMINPEGRNEEGRAKTAVDAYRTAWSEGGAGAVARAWASGPAKIRGLGPAFASKVAYFAAYDRDAGKGPLIADLNTAWAVWALAGISDSRSKPKQYAAYVEWCEGWAHRLDCRSDDIERALFSLGPRIRRINKRLAAKVAPEQTAGIE